MKSREKNQTNRKGRVNARRFGQGNLRSAREQAVFLYFLIVFILVSIHLDRGNAPEMGIIQVTAAQSGCT